MASKILFGGLQNIDLIRCHNIYHLPLSLEDIIIACTHSYGPNCLASFIKVALKFQDAVRGLIYSSSLGFAPCLIGTCSFRVPVLTTAVTWPLVLNAVYENDRVR